MMRKALLLVVALAVLASGVAVLSLFGPYAGFANETRVDIPRGTSTLEIARMLAETGVVRYRWQFLLARVFRPDAKLHAGEYRFHEAASVWQVFDRLSRGDVFYYALTVPEGDNLYDIAALLDKLRIIPGQDFLRAARDPSPIRDLAPKAVTLEGYLFPDTYRITKHTSAAHLCLQMTQRFRKAWKELGTSAPVHPNVTLASLIEKETAVPEERPLVASVFCNRLRIGMPLDCDPTVIYAALRENKYRGVLYRSDLESESRYNTYRHAGLPPGPIANPGLESLKAALAPADTQYLYFVAKPDGSGAHQFSRKLEAHRRAVRRYRRGNNKTDQASPAQKVPGRKPSGKNHRGGSAGTSTAAGAHI